MNYRTLMVFACCAGLAGGLGSTNAQAQSNNSDMDAALKALRQQESAPDAAKPAPKPAPPAAAATTPAPAAPVISTPIATDNSGALSVLRQLETAPPAPAQKSATPSAGAPPSATATASDANANATAVLRQQETAVPASAPPPASAPAATPSPTPSVAATPAVDPAVQAQRDFVAAKQAALQAEQKRQNDAEVKAYHAAQSGQDAKAQQQQEEIAARLMQAQDWQKAAAGMPAPTPPGTTATTPPMDATIAQQQIALQSATGQNTSASQPSLAMSQSAPLAGNVPASKEERLADLLRQRRAGDITDLQYFTQRARIIAEP